MLQWQRYSGLTRLFRTVSISILRYIVLITLLVTLCSIILSVIARAHKEFTFFIHSKHLTMSYSIVKHYNTLKLREYQLEDLLKISKTGE